MGVGLAVKELWSRVVGVEAGAEQRKTKPGVADAFGGAVPYLAPFVSGGKTAAVPKRTVANLRRFSETPAARRAINVIKDRIACMDWRIELGQDVVIGDDVAGRTRALRAALRSPNESDSFRTMIEAVLEDVLVGGYGAVEIETTGDAAAPVKLYPVDGATIEIDPAWSGDAGHARYAQRSGFGSAAVTSLLDSELMYIRLNPRTHTPFGLGKLEVAFDTITQFLEAHRYAARLASNSVVQYALWTADKTPEQHERLIHWWQDEVEGSGRVPLLSGAEKPEVLRFAAGTDADLRMQWQEFLLRMIANAFDIPPMLLGVAQDVNRSTAGELADEAFQQAVVPLAKLIAEHITRDVIRKALGWHDLQFVWSDLESRDELREMEIQTKLLAAGVLSVDEVREMRGLETKRETGKRKQETVLL